MVTPWEEKQLLQDVMDGLSVAIHREKAAIEQLDSIKLNKLVYLAVKDSELPVTYSWYKYGASLSDSDVKVDYIQPRALNELPTPDEPSIGNSWDYSSPEEYAWFYSKDVDLERILSEETKEYLRDFYDGYAPDGYQNVYKASAILQKSLDEILSMQIGEFNSKSSAFVSNVIDEARSLSFTLVMDDKFEDKVVDLFTSYIDLLCDFLSKRPDAGFDVVEYDTLKSLIHFYYSHAWKYIALLISERHVTGPSRRDLLKGVVNDLDSLEKTYSTELEKVGERCVKRGPLSEKDNEPLVMVSVQGEIDSDTIEEALDDVASSMGSREYGSIDPEEYSR